MFYNIFIELCKKNDVPQTRAVKDIGLNRASITKWKNGSTPNGSTLEKFAEYFEVSVDYLLGKDSSEKKLPTLTKKDERDIAKKLDETLHELQLDQDGLMFDGEPLDDLTKELLIQSLKNGLELSKKIAKEKYTPKKYRKDI